MSHKISVRIDGEVGRPAQLTYGDLDALDAQYQVPEAEGLDPKRKGDAVRLTGLLSVVRVKPSAKYIGLHSSTDDFHASIPLGPVRETAMVIYRRNGKPLEPKAGGPVRFHIPDHEACHTAEIDECANVKFVDHIELTAEKGFDNRPTDDGEHAKLHGEG